MISDVLDKQIPEPGIYENIPFETYLQWDAVSASRLKLASRSMAHYHAGFVGEETKAMRFGSLAHCGKLEPLAVAERYAVMPTFELDEENKTTKGVSTTSKNTLYYREQLGKFEAANRDKIFVEQREFDDMKGIVTALCENEQAMKSLIGKHEVSMVWIDPETGLFCKCRHDSISFETKRIGDLKTCQDCQWFERDVKRYQYHLQMAHYRYGVEVLTGEVLEPWLVAVEKTRPWGNMAAPVSERALEIGEKMRAERMRKIAECKKTNRWPGYASPDSWNVQEEAAKPVEVTIGGTKVLI